jgi:6-phosphogluconate dehydrogenase (decarboxylating)
MLRVEKIFEEDGIRHELESYVPLLPTGSNFKVTMQIEYADENRRREMLAKLKGVEDRVWVRVDGFDPVFAIADEDLERENEEKTSAVHFLRFELSSGMVAAAKSGAALSVGVDHPAYTDSTGALPEAVRASLACDLR